MDPDVLDQVRSTCAAVADQAAHVRIDTNLLPSYAAGLPLDVLAAPAIDPASHYLGQGEGTVAFLLTLGAINFGSGYFPHLHKRPGMSGYFTVASGLNDHFRAHGPLSAVDLGRLTPGDCTRIFGQSPENTVAGELMGLFATALNDLGRFLIHRFAGSFSALVEAADASAVRLVMLLREMPFYEDVASYGSLRVHFFKRAQLTAADLALAFGGQGPGRFDDLRRLTLFADNLVPHVLRMDNVLVYDEDLAARIDAGERIERGSPAEIELRACAVHAVEKLCAALGTQGQQVLPMELDYLLWNRGQQPYYKKIKPRHRTRTVFY